MELALIRWILEPLPTSFFFASSVERTSPVAAKFCGNHKACHLDFGSYSWYRPRSLLPFSMWKVVISGWSAKRAILFCGNDINAFELGKAIVITPSFFFSLLPLPGLDGDLGDALACLLGDGDLEGGTGSLSFLLPFLPLPSLPFDLS